MIKYIIKGDIFKIPRVKNYAHGCNCAGAMGKGIAVQFRKMFPEMYLQYKRLCLEGTFLPGDVFVYKYKEGFVFNLGTQSTWRTKATLGNIRESLTKMMAIAEEKGIDSIAITSTDIDFDDACDSDIRVAYNDHTIGKRVFVYANELGGQVLDNILNAIIKKYYPVSKICHWKRLWDVVENSYYNNGKTFIGNVEVPVNSLAFILKDYKEYQNLEI